MRTVYELPALLLVLIVVSFLSPASVHAAPNFTEGMWEVKGEFNMEGAKLPMPPPIIHYSQCLTKKDMVPYKQEKDQKCTRVSEKTSNNTIIWMMKCTDTKGTMIESTGTAAYTGDTFDAKVQNEMTASNGKKSNSSMTMRGRWTGPCK